MNIEAMGENSLTPKSVIHIPGFVDGWSFCFAVQHFRLGPLGSSFLKNQLVLLTFLHCPLALA